MTIAFRDVAKLTGATPRGWMRLMRSDERLRPFTRGGAFASRGVPDSARGRLVALVAQGRRSRPLLDERDLNLVGILVEVLAAGSLGSDPAPE